MSKKTNVDLGHPQQLSRATLSREQIVQVSISLLDEVGLDGFTMRRLADQLQVGTTTLYWHIPNKDDLLELVVDETLSEIEYPDIEHDNWKGSLKKLCHEYRTVIGRHSWIAPLIGKYTHIGPHSLRYLDALYNTLRRGKLSEENVGIAMHLLFHYVVGTSITEMTMPDYGEQSGITWARTIKAFLQMTDQVTSYPYLIQYLLGGGYNGLEARFDHGLEQLIDSFEQKQANVSDQKG